MTWDNAQYVKLLLNRRENGRDTWLIALRSTADYYGWTEKFPVWRPKPIGVQGGYTMVRMPNTGSEMFCSKGLHLRICRSPSTHGQPRSATNRFKVSTNATLFDIAEVAALTQVDWHWMSAPNGDRLSREHWLSIHEAGPRRSGGGLVSA